MRFHISMHRLVSVTAFALSIHALFASHGKAAGFDSIYPALRKTCEEPLTEGGIVAPRFYQAMPLSSTDGIILHPQPKSIEIPEVVREAPLVRELGRVWTLADLMRGRTPVRLERIQDPEAFSRPRGIRILDMPLRLAGTPLEYHLPREIQPFAPTIGQILAWEHSLTSEEVIKQYNVYLTIDQSAVSPGYSQRRPGAHVDGFQGASIAQKTPINHSYVVSNLTPTLFYTHPFDLRHLVDGVHDFFREMDRLADRERAVATEENVIYLMDAYAIHTATPAAEGGYRTFLRLSFDYERFNRTDNTWNPLLGTPWPTEPKRSFSAFKEFRPDEANPAALMAYLEQIPRVAAAFSSAFSASDWIRNHTKNALGVFNEKYANSIASPSDVRLLRYTLGLHDSGKPEALERGDKSRQFELTDPVIAETLTRLFFSREDVRLARALTFHDAIGEHQQGRINTAEAAQILHKAFQQANVSPQRFFQMQNIFYLSDAGSYWRIAPLISHEKLRALWTETWLQTIDQRVADSLKGKRKPLLVVDLDDSLFIHNSRVLRLLQKQDQLRGTHFFENATLSDMDGVYWEDFVGRRMGPAPQRTLVISEVRRARYHPATLLFDEAHTIFAERLRRWREQGAHIAIVTGRRTNLAEMTKAALDQAGVPYDDVYFLPDGSRYSMSEYKAATVRDILAMNPLLDWVAAFDDIHENLHAFRPLAPPDLLYLRILPSHSQFLMEIL